MIAVACFLAPQGAFGFSFGTEHIPLSTLVAQSIKQNLQLGTALAYLREATELARDGAELTKESVMVGKNVAAIINDPAGFLAYAAQGWTSAFPELQDIIANSMQVRESMYSALNPGSMLLYDPYAYVRAFNSLNAMTNDGFRVWMHAVDTFGLSETRDKQIRALSKQHEIALGESWARRACGQLLALEQWRSGGQHHCGYERVGGVERRGRRISCQSRPDGELGSGEPRQVRRHPGS